MDDCSSRGSSENQMTQNDRLTANVDMYPDEYQSSVMQGDMSRTGYEDSHSQQIHKQGDDLIYDDQSYSSASSYR